MPDGIVTTNASNVLEDWEFHIEMFDLEAVKKVTTTDRYEVPANIARALVRTDTGEIMGVHGSKYKPIHHSKVVDSIVDAVNKANISTDFVTEINTYESGRKLKGLIKFPDINVQPTVGDYTCLTIPFYNSYDASWAFSQSVQGLRLTCLNGQTISDMIARTTYKHTLNVDVDASAKKIQLGAECFMEHRDVWESWTKVQVTDDMAERFFKATIGNVKTHMTTPKVNQATMENVMRIWHDNASDLGSNKWALYNAMTYWSTHTDESRVPHNATRRREVEVSKALRSNQFKELELA